MQGLVPSQNEGEGAEVAVDGQQEAAGAAADTTLLSRSAVKERYRERITALKHQNLQFGVASACESLKLSYTHSHPSTTQSKSATMRTASSSLSNPLQMSRLLKWVSDLLFACSA
jgi:hypothetical protein